MLEDDYRRLLERENFEMTARIIDIAYELSSAYMVFPNYQVVKYIMTRIVTKDNLPENIPER